ncbi:protein of unknown function [Streptococcus thermophilus]|nr:protein of unknown function [Streptococcus thermophilus]CAD0132608.1 protein of unknown function [Streptococcus thermophilus]
MLSLLVVKSLKISIYDDNKPKKFLEQVLSVIGMAINLIKSFSTPMKHFKKLNMEISILSSKQRWLLDCVKLI